MTWSIDDADWMKLSPLLDQALDLAPAERDAWLLELGAAEPGLAAALRELLAEQAALETSRFLEDSPAAKPGEATLVGQRIAAYAIERMIGQGGMGTVWLAHRCDGRYEGKAAVKLLNAALIGGPAEQRFVREGHVLAALQHPYIAHLIDAGVAAGGQPYLILEHIEGTSIDEYCAQTRLGLRARLRVFLDVLDAVAYAHCHLVVHRDLKPANILVTKSGVVKLLDFGIATLLEPAVNEGTLQECTREIGAALTPEFAAPEQLLGQAVTTATDIYALGRVLYVLLGVPQSALTEGRSSADLARETLEREPPLLSELTAATATRRLIRGDLDNIARKALKSEPAERYATVEAFAADLRHYLANEPVSARPDSFGYRVGKFVQRHRGGVLTGTATAMALIGVTVFALLQMLEARQQRDEAEAQRQRSEGYSTAITSLLSQVGPGGRALTPDELLGRAVSQVEATYADDPAFLVHMLILISGRYFDLQNTNQEYATLVSAETVARQSGDPVLLFRVQCNTVETALAAGRKAEAERRLDEALALLPIIGTVPPLDHAACLRAKAEMARADGDLPLTLEQLDEAARLLESSGHTEGNVYAGILSTLASYHAQAGHLLVAHDYSVRLVDLNERLGRQNSMPGVIARLSLATSFLQFGEVQRALSIHREAAADRLPSAPGRMLYGEVLARLGDYDAGLPMIRDALAEIDKSGHQYFRIRVRLGLAQSLYFASRWAEAEQTLDEALMLMHRDEVKYRRRLIDAHRLRAGLLLAARNPGEAEEEVARALQLERRVGGDDPRRAQILLIRARIGIAENSPAEAAQAALAAATLFEANTLDPEQSADVGEALLVLAQAEAASGDAPSARRHLERAGRSLQNGLGADHLLTLAAQRLKTELEGPAGAIP